MRVYLDLCCFNRPFDEQSQPAVYLETEAKLILQRKIRNHEIELVWSYMLDFENSANPDHDVSSAIQAWEGTATVQVPPHASIVRAAQGIHSQGFYKKDALHLACAIAADADCFLTVDKGILRRSRSISTIEIINPVDFFGKGEGDAD